MYKIQQILNAHHCLYVYVARDGILYNFDMNGIYNLNNSRKYFQYYFIMSTGLWIKIKSQI